MATTSKIAACIPLLLLCLVGCTYQRHVDLPTPALPQQVYVKSRVDAHRESRVGVFRFSEPRYAPGMGRVAAETVYHELLRKGAFAQVKDETAQSDLSMSRMLDTALSRGYDLVITGDLLYYFDGSALQESRVAERIKVVDVSTNEILWYAGTVDEVNSALDNDYFLLLGQGAPAPPAKLLLQRNAEKFCNMLLEQRAQSLSDENRPETSQ